MKFKRRKLKNKNRIKMAGFGKIFFCSFVIAAVSLPTIEPNVIPLEAAFQGKPDLIFFMFRSGTVPDDFWAV